MERLNAHRALSRAQAFLTIGLIWAILGAALSVPDIVTGGSWPIFVAKEIEAGVWWLFTPGFIFVIRYLADHQVRPVWRGAVLIGLSVPVCFAHTYTSAVLQYPIQAITWNPLRDSIFARYYFIGGLVMCGAIIATLSAFQYYQRYLTGQLELERVQRRLLQAHLNTLRLQLEPHFLFNALNAISSEVVSNPELARDMIEDLGALLRLSLDYKDRAEISLSQEIIILEHYLALQKVRYGDRLKVEVSVAPDVVTTFVPCMLLQPLVENAIRHGISNRLSGGSIRVSASRVSNYVELRVEDDGVGLPQEWRWDAATGVGLATTRERLEALYPDAARYFDIRRRDEGGTLVVLRVPLNRADGGIDDRTKS